MIALILLCSLYVTPNLADCTEANAISFSPLYGEDSVSDFCGPRRTNTPSDISQFIPDGYKLKVICKVK